MKRLISSSLVFLLATAATELTVQAQTRTTSRVNSNPKVPDSFQATPFQLVFLAYRGHFRDWGIPSYDAFLSAYGQGKISAADIVAVGIEANRVPVQMLTDKRYLRAVKSYLDSLVAERS